MSTPDRRAMLERGNPTLSIRGQCRLLGIGRSGVYWRAAANDDEDLPLMLRIDALFTAWPFLGSRRMTAMLRADGLTINRKRVQRLMRVMGIAVSGRSRGRQSRRRGTRSSRICCATSVFGEGNISGNISVDPNAGPATWLGKLEQALKKLKIPGVERCSRAIPSASADCCRRPISTQSRPHSSQSSAPGSPSARCRTMLPRGLGRRRTRRWRRLQG